MKKLWLEDPLVCEKCGAHMKIIAFLEDRSVVPRILRHVGPLDDGLDEPNGRVPPEAAAAETAVEPFFDDLPNVQTSAGPADRSPRRVVILSRPLFGGPNAEVASSVRRFREESPDRALLEVCLVAQTPASR